MPGYSTLWPITHWLFLTVLSTTHLSQKLSAIFSFMENIFFLPLLL